MMRNFLPEKYVESATRPDLREDQEMHSFNDASGSSLIKLGNTIVCCTINHKIFPFDKNCPYRMPLEEILRINVKFAPTLNKQNKCGLLTNEYLQYLEDFLKDIAVCSKLINVDLMICNDHYIALMADITCISDDGNIPDCILISLISALVTCKIPDLSLLNKCNFIEKVDNLPKKTLELSNIPVSITILSFKNNKFIVDPTLYEESIADGKYIIVINNAATILKTFQTGMIPIKESSYNEVLQMAKKQAKILNDIIIGL